MKREGFSRIGGKKDVVVIEIGQEVLSQRIRLQGRSGRTQIDRLDSRGVVRERQRALGELPMVRHA